MPLCFPQHVKIKNARLQVLSNFLYCMVGAALLSRFVFFRQYGRHFPVQGTGNIVVDGLENVSRLSEVRQSMLSQKFCSEPSAFNFWYDASGSLRFENHTCLPACAPKALNSSRACVDTVELAVPDGPQSVVFITHVQETDIQEATIMNYFVPSVHALGVRVTFAYRVPQVQWYQVDKDSSEWKFHSSRYDVHTLVVDSSGSQWRTFAPGEDPSLSLNDLLELSGTNSLEKHQSLAGRNFYPNVSAAVAEAGPSVRVSGMELTVTLQCGNVHPGYSYIRLDTEKNTCILLVQAKETWVQTTTRFLENDKVRKYNGVRIKLAVEGILWVPDVNAIFVNIASSIVMLQFPRSLVFFIAVWCCGHISLIYRRLIYKKFNILNEAGAMAMRLLEHELAFNDLGNPINGHAGEISRESMSESISHLMERRGHSLDEKELQHMVAFCIDTVANTFHGADEEDENGIHMLLIHMFKWAKDHLSSLKEAFGVVRHEKFDSKVKIDVDKFASACSSTEPITFDALVRLFDKDRGRSCLETFFTPLKLRKCLKPEEFGSVSMGLWEKQDPSKSVPATHHHVRDLVSATKQHDDNLRDLAGQASQHHDTLVDVLGQMKTLRDRVHYLEQQLDHIKPSSEETHISIPEPELIKQNDTANAELQQQIGALEQVMETRMALIEQRFDEKLERSLASLSLHSSPREPDTSDPLFIHIESVGSLANRVGIDPTSECPEKMTSARQLPPNKKYSLPFAAPTTLYHLAQSTSR